MKVLLLIVALSFTSVSMAKKKTEPKKVSAPVSKESQLSKDDVLKELQKEVAHTEKLNKRRIYELLTTASTELNKKYSQEYLVKVLSVFENYNKLDETHYYVEMFVNLYQKRKKDFGAALDKALSPAQKAEFMRKLQIAITEKTEGNG